MVRMCSRPAGVVVSAPGEIGNQIQRHGTEPSARSQALVRISRRGPHCALNRPTVARVKRWTRTATVAGSLGLAAVIMSGCANGDGAGSTGSVEPGQVSGTFDTADRCIVRLHGKSGGGQPTIVDAGVTDVSPNGNAQGWGGRQWIYFPERGLHHSASGPRRPRDRPRNVAVRAGTECEDRPLLDWRSRQRRSRQVRLQTDRLDVRGRQRDRCRGVRCNARRDGASEPAQRP